MTEALYHGAVYAGTGYGEATRNALLALHRQGVKVELDSSGFAKATISIYPNKISVTRDVGNAALKFPLEMKEAFTKMKYAIARKDAPMVVHAPSVVYGDFAGPSLRKRIGYTAWETGRMIESWVDGCNLMDEVWIPCYHNRRVLQESGVHVPIHVVPHPIDSERFKPADVRLNSMFTFVSVFRWGLRKGWPEMFTAYERAFSADDRVVLRVLTNFRNAQHREEARKITEHFKRPGKPRVEILTPEFVPYDFMPLLYGNADAFLLLSRGEGFCLPCAEAMSAGCVPIVTNYSALPEYVDEENGFLVDYELVSCDDSTDPDREASAWAVADIGHAAGLMRQAFDNADALSAKKEAARLTIQEKFSFERVAKTMIGRLEANGG